MRRLLALCTLTGILLTACYSPDTTSTLGTSTSEQVASSYVQIPEPSGIGNSQTSGNASSFPTGNYMYADERADVTEVPFKNGPDGIEVATLSIGSEFLGLTLTGLEGSQYRAARDGVYGEWWIGDFEATFTGEVKLTGTLYNRLEEGGSLLPYEFYVDEKSEALLPYYVDGQRSVWFGFESHDTIIALLGETGWTNYECELTISRYRIIEMDAGVYNIATLTDLKVLT